MSDAYSWQHGFWWHGFWWHGFWQHGAAAVLFAMTNTFRTGVTLKVDGGGPLT
jgi:hypothetical protein